jgi:hypothetical protein
MNEETITVLVEVFTDVRVELEAVCLALQQKDIPRETIKALESEVDRTAIQNAVREKLLPALFS